MTYFIGVDVSKHKLDITWLKDLSSLKVKTKSFNNTVPEFNTIIAWFYENLGKDVLFSDIHVILEATGVYHENITYMI